MQKKNLKLSEHMQSLLNYGSSFHLPFRLKLRKSYVFKTPGHAADLPSFGVMN